MNMNLDDPTCIKKIELSLQGTNEPWFINIEREDLNFEFKLKPRYIVEVL
jgi:hypothetical protein